MPSPFFFGHGCFSAIFHIAAARRREQSYEHLLEEGWQFQVYGMVIKAKNHI